jgi:hypothetical protein
LCHVKGDGNTPAAPVSSSKKKDKKDAESNKDMVGIMVKLDLTNFAKDGTNTTETFAVPRSKGASETEPIAYAIQVWDCWIRKVVLAVTSAKRPFVGECS